MPNQTTPNTHTHTYTHTHTHAHTHTYTHYTHCHANRKLRLRPPYGVTSTINITVECKTVYVTLTLYRGTHLNKSGQWTRTSTLSAELFCGPTGPTLDLSLFRGYLIVCHFQYKFRNEMGAILRRINLS